MLVFLCFGSYILQSIQFQDKNKLKCSDKAAIKKFKKLRTVMIN